MPNSTPVPSAEELLSMIVEDEVEAPEVGVVCVDSGHIEIGDCGEAQVTVDTEIGDGIYPVYRIGHFIVIDVRAPNQRSDDDEIERDPAELERICP